MTKDEAIDILIGEVYSLLDDITDLNSDHKYALEKAVELVLSLTKEPFTRLQYRNMASQYQVSVLLSNPDVTEEDRAMLLQYSEFLDKLTLYTTPKEAVLDTLINEALNGTDQKAD